LNGGWKIRHKLYHQTTHYVCTKDKSVTLET
jgi:hypothetical protein